MSVLAKTVIQKAVITTFITSVEDLHCENKTTSHFRQCHVKEETVCYHRWGILWLVYQYSIHLPHRAA